MDRKYPPSRGNRLIARLSGAGLGLWRTACTIDHGELDRVCIISASNPGIFLHPDNTPAPFYHGPYPSQWPPETGSDLFIYDTLFCPLQAQFLLHWRENLLHRYRCGLFLGPYRCEAMSVTAATEKKASPPAAVTGNLGALTTRGVDVLVAPSRVSAAIWSRSSTWRNCFLCINAAVCGENQAPLPCWFALWWMLLLKAFEGFFFIKEKKNRCAILFRERA